MKKNILLIIMIVCLQSVTSFAQQLVTSLNYTGSVQTFTVPATGKYILETWGAQGGNDPEYPTTVFGGRGGYSKGEVTLTAGTVLYIYIGGQGSGCTSSSWNSTGGGGSSDIRLVGGNWNDNAGLYSRIIVAGGGGGRHGKNYEGIDYVGNDGGGASAPSYTIIGVNVTGADDTSGGNSDYGYSVVPGSFGYANPGVESNSCSVGGWNGGERGSDNWAHGGAGGGWYGGVQSWPTGSGGSGYVLTPASYKPAGYTPDASYYMDNTELIAGNTTMPDPAGGNMTGRSGNGAVVITQLYAAAISQTTNVICNTDTTGALSVAVSGGTGPYTYSWSPNVSTTSTASGLGVGAYDVTVTDGNGTQTTTSFTIVATDNVKPTVLVQNITVQLDAAGTATIVASDIDNGSTDTCGIKTIELDTTSFTCSNIGVNTVTLKVTDTNDNVATETAIVTVEDKIAPVVATKNITVQLDAAGTATIVASDIDNGSTDACGIKTIELDTTSFTCSNIGANTVTLKVTDNNDNVATETATVTVEDKIAPVVATKNITVQLDATGAATIVAADVDNGSTDACGIATLVVSPNTFTCVNVGANTVTLTATDASGNSTSQVATVTIENKNLPVVTTKNSIVQLDATGNATITDADVNNGSTVSCGTPSLVVSPDTFTCVNVGANTVTLTVTDANGNTASQTAIVTIQDKIGATVLTKNLTVQLDASGNAAITAAQIDNGSSDSCGVASVAISPTAFNCNNVGANVVTLTVTDVNGNKSTGTATVTVQEIILPTVKTKDITVELDVAGNASILPSEINDGSFDNCGIASLSLDKLSFSCNNVGVNTVVLTVKDASGNTASLTAKVTVVNKSGDNDNDGILDNCDNDDDNDGILDTVDNCPITANPFQEDRNHNGLGDACDSEQMNISQAFTPNGDGVNETWVVSNIEQYPNSVVRVFNRWGTEVFVGRNYQNDWDGHYKGASKSLPESSSYYYQIDLDGDGSIDKEGWIYINR